MRRDHVASTLIRHFGTKCPLGSSFVIVLWLRRQCPVHQKIKKRRKDLNDVRTELLNRPLIIRLYYFKPTIDLLSFQAEIKALQLELSKTKSQFTTMAGSMADSVVNQMNQAKMNYGSRKTPDVETGNDLKFQNKKPKRSETVPNVQLLSYTRRGSIG